jgi:hypothetical protein
MHSAGILSCDCPRTTTATPFPHRLARRLAPAGKRPAELQLDALPDRALPASRLHHSEKMVVVETASKRMVERKPSLCTS